MIAASNYTSYDAAVYAAASSYLQSKAAGAGNVWMGASKKNTSTSYSGSNSFSGVTSSNIAVTGGSSRGYTNVRGMFMFELAGNIAA